MPGLDRLQMGEKKGQALAGASPGLGHRHARFKSCLLLTCGVSLELRSLRLQEGTWVFRCVLAPPVLPASSLCGLECIITLPRRVHGGSPRGAMLDIRVVSVVVGCRHCPVCIIEVGASEAQVLGLETESLSPRGSCQTLDLGSEGI